ncbi:Os03g0184201, partial [Oryza sativa Japonica Group]
ARRSTSPLTLAAAACVALAGPALVALAAAAAACVALAGRALVTLAAAALVALATAAACIVLAGPALVACVALTGRALSRSTPPPPLALCSRCLTRSANVSSLPGRMMPKKCKSSLGFI